MSDDLTFAMGEFQAAFPTDRLYAKNHMWARQTGDVYRFGFTAYAVRLLQDVYFLDWAVDAGVTLTSGQEIGAIESKKAESSLYSPVSGELTIFNPGVISDPSTINTDKYESGWLFEIRSNSTGELMTTAAYVEMLDDVWEKTQRTIKGQMNTD
jgi:glycine cleavage system H protein